MKKIPILASLVFMMFLSSCYEDYKIDFEYSATYFANQTPIRTLVMEEGKELSIEVGAVLAGKYESNQSETVKFEIKPDLLTDTDLFLNDRTKAKLLKLKLMPEKYYTLSHESDIVIPSGKFHGGVKVTFTEEFLSDPEAHLPVYALPFKIVSSTLDSIKTDKDFSIVVVKFINEQHGDYWRKGVDYTFSDDGLTYVDTLTAIYSKSDLYENKFINISTLGKMKSKSNYVGRRLINPKEPLNNEMAFEVNENVNTGNLSKIETSIMTELTGDLEINPDTKDMTLKYQYTLDGQKHDVFDTLVFIKTHLVYERWGE